MMFYIDPCMLSRIMRYCSFIHKLYCKTTQVSNTFQAVLATNGNKTFVLFLYHDIKWSIATLIGFNVGDGVNYYIVPESLTADGVLNLDSTSNVGIPGMYIYRVDQDPCMYNVLSQHYVLLCCMMHS